MVILSIFAYPNSKSAILIPPKFASEMAIFDFLNFVIKPEMSCAFAQVGSRTRRMNARILVSCRGEHSGSLGALAIG